MGDIGRPFERFGPIPVACRHDAVVGEAGRALT